MYAQAIIKSGEKVLMVRKKGVWKLPGGYIAPDEKPDQAAIRGVLEETGYEAIIDFVFMIEKEKEAYTYVCHLTHENLLLDKNTAEVVWVLIDEVKSFNKGLTHIFPNN